MKASFQILLITVFSIFSSICLAQSKEVRWIVKFENDPTKYYLTLDWNIHKLNKEGNFEKVGYVTCCDCPDFEASVKMSTQPTCFLNGSEIFDFDGKKVGAFQSYKNVTGIAWNKEWCTEKKQPENPKQTQTPKQTQIRRPIRPIFDDN